MTELGRIFSNLTRNDNYKVDELVEEGLFIFFLPISLSSTNAEETTTLGTIMLHGLKGSPT
jgi:hypothetical protein